MRKDYLAAINSGRGKHQKIFLYSIFSLFFFFSLSQNLKAQTGTSAINYTSQPAVPSSYTVGPTTYNWGQGNDLILNNVVVGGTTFIYDATALRTLSLVRVDNPPTIVGYPSGLMAEYTISDIMVNPTLPAADANGSRMEDALLQPIINRGALDVFHNAAGFQTENNIERVDVLFTPFLSPSAAPLLNEIGYLVSEKSGNNTFKVAAVTSLDGFGAPLTYGPLVTVSAANYGDPTPTFGWSFYENLSTPPHGEPTRYTISSERIGMSLITFNA